MKPKGDECLPDDFVVECPQPEFPLNKNVLKGVREPKIEFRNKFCADCGIPMEMSKADFCDECYTALYAR